MSSLNVFIHLLFDNLCFKTEAVRTPSFAKVLGSIVRERFRRAANKIDTSRAIFLLLFRTSMTVYPIPFTLPRPSRRAIFRIGSVMRKRYLPFAALCPR